MTFLTWYDFLVLIGVPSLISGLALFLFARFVNRRDKKREEKEKEERATREDIAALKEGQQAALQMMLYRYGDKYLERGYITLLEKTCYEKMYNSYHKLGQNGVMTDMYERVIALPNKPVVVAIGYKKKKSKQHQQAPAQTAV